MEGTHSEETETIQEDTEEFEGDQGYGESCEENESSYQIYASRHSDNYSSH